MFDVSRLQIRRNLIRLSFAVEMEMEKFGERSGGFFKLGKLSSHLMKDSLRIARLAFVDVSAAEMMTEDATNTEEWGPTTKTMAAISEASKNYDDYVRIVEVLRGRLSLIGTKKWRQIFKALTVMEYLITHGPEQFILEFREDKKRIEELTRFVFVDENLVDRGSALQSKARQVNGLLVDETFCKEQRRRAQAVAKGILGFGSQSLKPGEPRPDFRKCNTHHGAYEPPSSPSPQRSSASSASDSPAISSASTEWNPFDESPTSSGSFSSSPVAGGWGDASVARKLSVELELSSTASKLPSPSRCRVPPPPPGGSKVGPNQQRSRSFSKSVPDLILM